MVNEPVDIKFREGVVIRLMFCTKAKPLPLHYKAETDKMIKEMFEVGMIGRAEGYSEWCSPATFIPNPNDRLHHMHMHQQPD